jgi:hypothetical protein
VQLVFILSSRPSPKRQKVIRSIAIDEETLGKIHKEANERKASVNALLQEIIDYYINIGSFSRNIGLIHIGHPVFKMLVRAIDAQALSATTPEELRDSFETWVELRGMKRDLPTFMKVLEYHESMGWGIIEVHKQPNHCQKIVFTHSLGQVWTDFLIKWFEVGYEYMAGGKLAPESFKRIANGFSATIPPSPVG